MVITKYKIINDKGLHARPATILVNEASKYKSKISLTVGGVTVDMKSIMGVMSIGVYKDQIIEVCIEGIDEVDANMNIWGIFNELRLAVEL